MKHSILIPTVLSAAILAACGGGGSSDTPTTGAGTPVTPAALTLTGVAATGAAIVGGKVDIKCAAGTGTATTIADGSYTVSITGGSLPCVLKVTTGSAELYSLTENSGGSIVRANITPFTQLVAAQIVGGNPANLYGSFDASAQTKLSAATVASAITAITDALKGTVDLGGANPLTATFTIGDAFDKQLDAFKAALDKAQVTLADVTAAVAASGGSAAPVLTIIQPAATGCAGLRSGKYRAINPNETDPKWANHVFQLNVDTMTISLWDGSTATLTDQGGCSFLTNEGGQVLVSKSGLTVVRDTPAGAPTQTQVSVIVPEQTLALSDLAGTWNALSYERATAGGPLKPASVVFTIDASGAFTSGSDCVGLAACTPWTGLPGKLTANAAGGFQFTDTDGTTYRVAAFKTADGQVSLYMLDPNAMGMTVAAKQQALTLPTVGAANSFWDFTIGANGYASALSEAATTITAVDAASQSYTRARSSDGRVDSLTLNKPRDGLRYRAAGTSPTSTGGTVNFSELINLPLPGTGVVVYESAAATQNFFGISINKP